MLKPICGTCSREFTKIRSGVPVIEMMSEKRPYKIWSVDLWKCFSCNIKIYEGYGNEPVIEHFEEGFEERVTEAQLDKDCIQFGQKLIGEVSWE